MIHGYLHSARESRRSTAGVNRVSCVVDIRQNRKCKALCRRIVAQPTLNNQVPPNPENPSGTACEGNRNRRTDCGSGIGVTAGWHSQCFVGSRTCKHPTQRDSTRGKPRRSRRGGCHPRSSISWSSWSRMNEERLRCCSSIHSSWSSRMVIVFRSLLGGFSTGEI